MPVVDAENLIRERVAAIGEFHRVVGTPRAELDLSGGVDSAVMLGLLARALGPGAITAVFTGIHSSPSSRARATEAAAVFGVALVDLDVSDLFDGLIDRVQRALGAAGRDVAALRAAMAADPAILGSIRSCLRAPIGRGINRMVGGGIRHGTGNECEDRFLRFYQKGGDGEVDTCPISMLAKGEVYQLARALGVPRSILVAAPTPDLHAIGEHHTDEEELLALHGIAWTYSRIDPDTGEYTVVGTIEKLGRLLDRAHAGTLVEPLLFGPAEPPWTALVELAGAFEFAGFSPPDVDAYLRSARRIEAQTRHKHAPQLPLLGSRKALVEAGILTDRLPGTPG